MTHDKKKGAFDLWQRGDKGGNEKAHEHAHNSRTSHKQNMGHGGHGHGHRGSGSHGSDGGNR
jgi:hypothetical protein